MSEHSTTAGELIGYITFDAPGEQPTLVLCNRVGRPLRYIALAPMGAVARYVRTIALRLGSYRNAYRAVTRDQDDTRTFTVWIGHDGSVIVANTLGEAWLRSTGERARTPKPVVHVIPNPEVITVVRRYGYGDASRN